MPESDKHRQLVQQIRAWVEYHHPNLAQLIVDDADSYLGRERPPDIDGFRPDAYVPGRNQRVTIVGEAKTAMDLDTQHTREQIAAYVRFLTTSWSGIIVLSTEWRAIRTARSLVKRIIKLEQITAVNAIVISDIDRFDSDSSI